MVTDVQRRLMAEMPAIRADGYCHARLRCAHEPLTHICQRARTHPDAHLCACGMEWEVRDDMVGLAE